MKVRAIVFAFVAAITTQAWGQATTAPSSAGVQSGEITGSNVYVRSGPGQRAYPCVKISKPAKVEVVGTRSGWMQIRATPGCFSVISKQFVTADGKTGTVTTDNIWVRAGGEEKASDFWAIQSRLNKGDQVEILGQVTDKDGEWYKIVSPKDAYFWISEQFVKLGAGEVAAKTNGGSVSVAVGPKTGTESAGGSADVKVVAGTVPGLADGSAGKVTDNGVKSTEVTVIKTTKTETRSVPAAPDKSLDAWKSAEKDLMEEYKKPAEQRNLDTLLAKYQAIEVPKGSPLKSYVDYRVQFLQGQIRLMSDLRDNEARRKKQQEEQAKFEQDRIAREANTTVNAPTYETRFSAQGVLYPSEIFVAGALGPKRYIVRDRQTLRIDAYVQCTTDLVDLSKYVGMEIGVKGTSAYDKNLNLDVVEAKSVTVLSEKKVELPTPPKPVINLPETPAKVILVPVPTKAEPAKTEPAKTEPAKTEPGKIEAPLTIKVEPTPTTEPAAPTPLVPPTLPTPPVTPAATTTPASMPAALPELPVAPTPVTPTPAPVVPAPTPVVPAPAPTPIEPAKVVPAPETPPTAPTTQPAPKSEDKPDFGGDSKVAPLPPTGLPLVPTSKPGTSVNVKEFQ